MMLQIYYYIRDNRSRSISIFKVFTTAILGIVGLSAYFYAKASYGPFVLLTFLVSGFTTVIWWLLYHKEKFNKIIASFFLGLDMIIFSVIFLPLAYASPLYPILFISGFIGLRLFLGRRFGGRIGLAVLALFSTALFSYYYAGILENPLYHFSINFFPVVLLNFVMSFTLTVISNLQKNQKSLETEKSSLNQANRSLKRELFLNTQLVNSLNKDVQRKNIEIKNILNLSGQLNINSDSKKAIESFLYTVIGQLGCKHALILTQKKKENNYYSIFSSKGLHGIDQSMIRIYLNSNLLNTFNSIREPMLERSIPREDLYSDEIKLLNHFTGDLFCPISIRGQLAGILVAGEKITGKPFSKEDINLISIVANQAAFIMEQTQATSEFQDIYFKTIKAMMKSLEAKYVFARGHNTRTANYVNIIASKIGLDQSEVKDLTYGTLLHDVGKIAIRDKYLLDPNVFKEDQTIVKKKILEHTIKGATILKSAGFDDKIVNLAMHHHEDYNGHGFPHGIGEKDIPLTVRILSVCNTYDAMTSDRPHRKALSELTAKEYLEYNSNKKFDPQVVKAFLSELSINKEMQKFH